MAKLIDETLAAAWARDKIEPAEPADDAEFLRRAYLDVIGKIPSVAELEAFLADTKAGQAAAGDR